MSTDSPGTLMALTVALVASTLGMCVCLAVVAVKATALWGRCTRIRGGVEPRMGVLNKALNGVTLAAFTLRGHADDLAERVTPRAWTLREEAARIVAVWKPSPATASRRTT